ncbi:hypothetical protein RZS08_12585, partial [Arthrospira platensis SPKY1]|nr:hypothetical protein [Arthrospira platensis SPKY1]
MVDQASEDTFARIFGQHFGRMLYTNITGRDQGRILSENDHYTPKRGVSYGHTFSEGCRNPEQVRGEWAIAVQQLGYRMRGYGLRASDFGGFVGFNSPNQPPVGFQFSTDAPTHIDDLIYRGCLAASHRIVEGAIRAGREIRNIGLWCGQPDRSAQLHLFHQEE